jgi:UDP-GlcNAc:undecaprenyl-phosphate/decaprenyl-phosphate GlcNAc-1-phosphate transferase
VLATFNFIVAMFITMVLIPPLMKVALRWSFLDIPDARKVHSLPIPRIGGVAMVVGAVAPILLWGEQSREVIAFLLGVGVILIFGVWDDRRSLNYRYKFLGQLIAVGVVIFYGNVVIKYVPGFGLDPIPYAASVPLTFFALLGITNAINLADGLDGLAGGTTFMSIAGLSLLAYISGDGSVLLLAAAVMGAVVGFLRFNTYPARVFMGDAGSQFLGFTAGVLVILLTQRGNPALSPAMPLLLLGLPILDTFVVMTQRLLDGRSPFSPDRNHLHHKLLSLGYDHYESVVLIYAAQGVLVTSAVYFRYYPDIFNLLLYAGFSVATIAFFFTLKRVQWRTRGSAGAEQMTFLTRTIVTLREREILTRYPKLYVAAFVPLYLIFAILKLERIPADAIFTVSALVCVAMALFVKMKSASTVTLVERLIMCTTITAGVYYYVTGAGQDTPLLSLENAGFVGLAAALVTAYRFSKSRAFQVTPMDFLVLFAVLIVPNMLGASTVSGDLGEVAAKSVMLYYAVEFLISHSTSVGWPMRAVTTSVLALFTAKALLL